MRSSASLPRVKARVGGVAGCFWRGSSSASFESLPSVRRGHSALCLRPAVAQALSIPLPTRRQRGEEAAGRRRALAVRSARRLLSCSRCCGLQSPGRWGGESGRTRREEKAEPRNARCRLLYSQSRTERSTQQPLRRRLSASLSGAGLAGRPPA